MTKSKNIFYLLLIAGTLFSSCKKNLVTEAPKRLVKFFNSSVPAEATTFKYDTQGRLIDETSPYAGYKFAYTNNVFSGSYTDQNNNTPYVYSNGKLDKNGRLLQVDGLYTPQNGPSSSHKYVFTYDANGYLIKTTQTDITDNIVSEDTYTYNNGDLVSDINTYNGQPNYTMEYEYFDNLSNKLSMDINQTVFGFFSDGLTGKRSKDLLKEERSYDIQNVKQLDYIFQYKLDNDGFPVSYTAQNLVNNAQWGRGFEYNK